MSAPSELGLREQKKRQTRERIAAAAAALFAEHGYEHVAVTQVAVAANVSEQTVYNYFPTKQQLVLDRERELTEQLVRLVRDRPPRSTPAAAVRGEAVALVAAIEHLSTEQLRGGLGHLAAVSPTVRRLALEMTDRLAEQIAAAISDNPKAPPAHLARLQATAIAWVFQAITDESGRRSVAGKRPPRIARELRPIAEDLIASVDRWQRLT
jgi:AcrR family transcriptional regulator